LTSEFTGLQGQVETYSGCFVDRLSCHALFRPSLVCVGPSLRPEAADCKPSQPAIGTASGEYAITSPILTYATEQPDGTSNLSDFCSQDQAEIMWSAPASDLVSKDRRSVLPSTATTPSNWSWLGVLLQQVHQFECLL